ncbi:MAG TPA: hypothetical protein VFS10_06890 [Pyrinomonadaceae bacterium]|nr:hypothetical protein [Pyrinomonadaceae bacterium]
MKLPNSERALVEVEKLRDYALNPDHERGKHKARVLRSALGLTQADAERLRQMVLSAADTEDAKPGRVFPYGQMYTLDFDVQGLFGMVTIRTGWIVATGTDFPRLVTCYVR